MLRSVRVAVVQAAPVHLDLEGSLGRASTAGFFRFSSALQVVVSRRCAQPRHTDTWRLTRSARGRGELSRALGRGRMTIITNAADVDLDATKKVYVTVHELPGSRVIMHISITDVQGRGGQIVTILRRSPRGAFDFVQNVFQFTASTPSSRRSLPERCCSRPDD